VIENEIKYVLRPDCFSDVSTALEGFAKPIRQGYLPGNGRIRMVDDHILTFTYKLAADNTIYEIEKKITLSEFAQLWPHTTNRLRKTRFSQKIENVQWDIDFFRNEDDSIYFAMAEAEMPEHMEQPPYLHPVIEPYLLYAVPREHSSSFTSKLISNPEYAKKTMESLLSGEF
jgi:CYTH domain-containing protein